MQFKQLAEHGNAHNRLSVSLSRATAGAGPYRLTMTGELLKSQIAATVRQLIVGEHGEETNSSWDGDDPNPIPLDSPVRTVIGDPAMFVGGVRALLFQTLHPVAMFAVAEHSDYENDPLGRLQRTAHFIGRTSYGSGTEADQAIELVRSIHRRVVGTLPDGTPYRADDPHLLGWIHATEVDSFLLAYHRYGTAPLAPDEADRFVADMGLIGSALGAEDVPQSQAELAATLDSYRSELKPTNECRDATRFLFAPALPLSVLPFYGLIFSSACALLPRWARSMLLLPVVPGINPLVLRPATIALTNTLRWAQATGPVSEHVPAPSAS